MEAAALRPPLPKGLAAASGRRQPFATPCLRGKVAQGAGPADVIIDTGQPRWRDKDEEAAQLFDIYIYIYIYTRRYGGG